MSGSLIWSSNRVLRIVAARPRELWVLHSVPSYTGKSITYVYTEHSDPEYRLELLVFKVHRSKLGDILFPTTWWERCIQRKAAKSVWFFDKTMLCAYHIEQCTFNPEPSHNFGVLRIPDDPAMRRTGELAI